MAEYALAVDVGGTKVESALVDEVGRVLDASRVREPTGRDSTADELASSVLRAVRATLAAAPGVVVAGAGVASAGPVSVQDGTVSPLNLPAWREHPLRRLVADAAGTDAVSLRHDGLCMALAETWLGGLRDVRTGVAMVVSTGVGGGLLVDGRLVAGASGNAGHVGQLLIADPSSPGRMTTLESIAAGPQIVEWATAHGWQGTSGEELSTAIRDGDAVALAALDRCIDAIGDAIASMAALLDLERVTIGGGFANVSRDLVPRIRRRFDTAVALPSAKGVAIVPSSLGDAGPLQGAAGLVHRADLLPAVG